MIKKIIINPIYVLIFLLFSSSVYLSLLINAPDENNFYMIILMIIILNIIVMRIFYVKNLKSNTSNIKKLSYKDITFNKLVNHIIYLVIIYIFFTPGPFMDYLLYYFLLMIILALSFAIENLMLRQTYDN